MYGPMFESITLNYTAETLLCALMFSHFVHFPQLTQIPINEYHSLHLHPREMCSICMPYIRYSSPYIVFMVWYNRSRLSSTIYLIYGPCGFTSFWQLCGTGWFLWGKPLFYVLNNMLFTAYECLNWTCQALLHTHLGKNMWSHVHTYM